MSDNNPDLVAQEVDEDLRRDQLVALWKTYGKYIIGTAIGIALIVAGREIYTAQVQSAQEANARIFAEATANAEAGDAIAVWTAATAELGDGYKTLATLQLAQAYAAAGNTSEAITAFKIVAADSSVGPVFQDLATFQAAQLLMQDGQAAEAKPYLQGVAVKGKPWYFSAQEQLAFLDLKDGQLESALTRFTLLADDAETPSSIKLRAGNFRMMMEQKVGNIGDAVESGEEENE